MVLKVYDLTNTSSPSGTFAEITRILAMIDPLHDMTLLNNVYGDIIRLFNGKFPGYRASNTRYHNLEHTSAVTLATARLLHGLHVKGDPVAPEVMELGLISAMFHDTGLIQTEDEPVGTGAQFTIGHEERSIALMENYLSGMGFPAESIEDCRHIIMCTILTLPIGDIPFRNDAIKTMGKVLGSADLIAQMSDRNYLEKLPLLFLEFEEAKVPGFETPLELFKNTEEFYHSVVRKRLIEEMDNVATAALFHFVERWNVDRDLYAEAITNNIEYMKKIYEDCADSYSCLLKRIRRKI